MDKPHQEFVTVKMLFVTALLFLILGTQAQNCPKLEAAVQNVYVNFLTIYNQNLIWSDSISYMALKELKEPGSVMKDCLPYVEIKGTWTFSKYNIGTMEQKIQQTLAFGGFASKWQLVYNLGNGAKFGCNSVYVEGQTRNTVTVLCLFQNQN
ncbi:hypothetical protein TELCIR_00024 [Teladorsagia circumcincta]|uniref:SCP domain-containing protein n=1 Tax=Teladorsagia circumcincta TaxID=45464 RepID=A0A2G9V5T3_TELCI|nr:hypothetical protein TELCIR_00024 [Teladorsagia circumcincta]